MLSWNEIRNRAQSFSREWAEETREAGAYQTFWDDFFSIFGIRRRSVALYQKKVELLGGGRGFIDLFWPGTFLAEHKSAGQDLDAAFAQAVPKRDARRLVQSRNNAQGFTGRSRRIRSRR